MAKPSWLKLNPSTGSGNGTIANSADAHTGRTARTGTVTVTGVGVSTPSTYKVTQSPKSEFASFDNGSEMSAPKTAGTVNGTQTNNAATITGDPGATAEFPFSIELEFPKNDTIGEVIRTLKVTANGGQAAQIAIKQAAGDATLSVSPAEITIPQSGSAVSVNVTSNTSWTAA